PGDQPDQTTSPGNDKHRSPTVGSHQISGQGSADRRSVLGPGHVNSDSEPSLLLTEMFADVTHAGGSNDRFPHSQQNPYRDQAIQRADQSRSGGDSAPQKESDCVRPL